MIVERIILSICIPVYNQIEIVRECIKHIIVSESNRFEIVISDDGSSEPIETMVQEIGDRRIKYYRNAINLGHDRNIIAAFSRAKGEYAFLLRSRDFVAPDGIEKIIAFLESKTGISYLTTSAYDSNGIPKLVYNDHIYQKGIEAIRAHNKLYVHPSGSVYNLSMLCLPEIRGYLDDVAATSKNFTVHSLMRLLLAEKGDFATCHFFSWIYADTVEASDIAMNRDTNKISVYDSKYQLERYYTEMLWADKILKEEWKEEQYITLFSLYLYAVTWNNKLTYCDKRMRRHYDYTYKKIDCKSEREKFLHYVETVESKLNIKDQKYYEQKERIIWHNKTIDFGKYIYLRLKMVIPFKEKLKKILYGGSICFRKVI